jgi:hypothetical protein
LPDDFMSGGKRNEMSEALASDAITVMDEFSHRIRERNDFCGRHKKDGKKSRINPPVRTPNSCAEIRYCWRERLSSNASAARDELLLIRR